jgi:hypothetical protein
MIPVVFLFTGLGSTAAHADTLLCGGSTCSSGGYVTEIESLPIDGTLYNVTFGTTDSNPSPFNTNGDAGDAASDIVSALGTYSIVSSATYGGNGYHYFCVDQGGGGCALYAIAQGEGIPTWINIEASTSIVSLETEIPYGGIYFTEFSPDVATPEPGAFMLTLTGVGLLGLMVVMRKRYARSFPQAN